MQTTRDPQRGDDVPAIDGDELAKKGSIFSDLLAEATALLRVSATPIRIRNG
jgi:hypothetical protein